MPRPSVAAMLGVAGNRDDWEGAGGGGAFRGLGNKAQTGGEMMCGGGLGGVAVPRSRGRPQTSTISRRRRSGRPPWDRPIMPIRPWQRCSVEAWKVGGPSRPERGEISAVAASLKEQTPSRGSAHNAPSVRGSHAGGGRKQG